jgi:hypothetical protein
MIFVDRSLVPEPPSLSAAMHDAVGERAKVRAIYPKPPVKPAKTFNFKAYKAVDVKKGIETLFRNKCA